MIKILLKKELGYKLKIQVIMIIQKVIQKLKKVRQMKTFSNMDVLFYF
jgi:hypothetical protein